MKAIRTGVVDFLNAMPLWHALRQDPRFELVPGRPSVIAEQLEKGDLDLGLLPIVQLFRGVPKRLLSHCGVSANGKVDSVLLFHSSPLPEVNRIVLDGASRTSAALVKTLMHGHWNQQVEFVACEAGQTPSPETHEGEAALIIGDVALAEREAFQNTDLCSAWHEMTGLPFVFAGWLARENADIATDIRDLLAHALELGVRQIPEIVGSYAGKRGIDAEVAQHYLTSTIHFELGDSEFAGLKEFARRAFELELTDREDFSTL